MTNGNRSYLVKIRSFRQRFVFKPNCEPNGYCVDLQVNFLEGTVELGLLQDMDRPLLSKMKPKRMKSPGRELIEADGQNYPTFADRETQTDGMLTRAPMQDFQLQVPEKRPIRPVLSKSKSTANA